MSLGHAICAVAHPNSRSPLLLGGTRFERALSIFGEDATYQGTLDIEKIMQNDIIDHGCRSRRCEGRCELHDHPVHGTWIRSKHKQSLPNTRMDLVTEPVERCLRLGALS